MHVIWKAEEAACCQSESAGLPSPRVGGVGSVLGGAASSLVVLGSSVSMMLARGAHWSRLGSLRVHSPRNHLKAYEWYQGREISH